MPSAVESISILSGNNNNNFEQPSDATLRMTSSLECFLGCLLIQVMGPTSPQRGSHVWKGWANGLSGIGRFLLLGGWFVMVCHVHTCRHVWNCLFWNKEDHPKCFFAHVYIYFYLFISNIDPINSTCWIERNCDDSISLRAETHNVSNMFRLTPLRPLMFPHFGDLGPLLYLTKLPWVNWRQKFDDQNQTVIDMYMYVWCVCILNLQYIYLMLIEKVRLITWYVWETRHKSWDFNPTNLNWLSCRISEPSAVLYILHTVLDPT